MSACPADMLPILRASMQPAIKFDGLVASVPQSVAISASTNASVTASSYAKIELIDLGLKGGDCLAQGEYISIGISKLIFQFLI